MMEEELLVDVPRYAETTDPSRTDILNDTDRASACQLICLLLFDYCGEIMSVWRLQAQIEDSLLEFMKAVAKGGLRRGVGGRCDDVGDVVLLL